MKVKLSLIAWVLIFLAGCQVDRNTDEITYPQPSVEIPNQQVEVPADSQIDEESPVETPIDSEVDEETSVTPPEDSIECPVSATINQAVVLLQLDMKDTQLAALIHNPSDAQVAVLDQLDVIEYKEALVEERLLIVPQHIGSKVTIYQVRYEDDKFIEEAALLETQIVEDSQVIDLYCSLPEGIPHLKIVVEYNKTCTEYLVTYDGLGTRAPIEFME